MIDLSDANAVRAHRPFLIAHRGGVIAPNALLPPFVWRQRMDIAWWKSTLRKRKTVSQSYTMTGP
jgi:hypothetical protein